MEVALSGIVFVEAAAGGRFWGPCPFYHQKTVSFTVDPDKKLYHCFGCGQGAVLSIS